MMNTYLCQFFIMILSQQFVKQGNNNKAEKILFIMKSYKCYFTGLCFLTAKALYVDLVKKTPGMSSSSSEIKEVLIMWEKMKIFVEKHHPNKAVSGRCKNI